MSPIEALAPLGIDCRMTVAGKICTVNLPHVDVKETYKLTKHVLQINEALQKASLLSKWRATTGGTTNERWILLVGTGCK